MHVDGEALYFQRHPQSYATIATATEAAKEKHAKHKRAFSIYCLVGTTIVDPKDIQLELFK